MTEEVAPQENESAHTGTALPVSQHATLPSSFVGALKRVWVVVAAALLVGLTLGWTANNQESEIATLESRVTELQEEITETASKLESAEAKNSDLERDNADLDRQLLELTAAIPIPDYSGETATKVKSDASDHGWEVSTKSEPSPKPAGTVLSQSPAPGTEMKYGATVTLVVAEAMPEQWYPVWTQTGRGRVVTPVIDLPDVDAGDLRVTYDFKSSGHNALWLCNMMGEKEDLLHNEIGAFKNTSTLYISWDGCVLDIEGGGAWTVTIEAFGVPGA